MGRRAQDDHSAGQTENTGSGDGAGSFPLPITDGPCSGPAGQQRPLLWTYTGGWRRLSRVPWTARRSNQSILKISPGCSLERLMLKLKLQSFGHLI